MFREFFYARKQVLALFLALCGALCPLKPLKKEGDGSFRPPPFSTVSTGRALRIRLKTRLKPVFGHKKTPETQAFREFWLEVTPGFEPGNEGFADPCLTTWLCHRVSENHYTIYRRSLSRVKCPLKRDFFHCFCATSRLSLLQPQKKLQKEIEQMLQCAKGCDIIEPEEQRTRRTYKKRTCADTGRVKGAWLWRR